MILGKMRIYNFKSIIDSGEIFLSQGDLITILAGQNESGKTAFLRALRFFEEGAYTKFEEEDRRKGTSPRVECTFYLTPGEYEQLKNDTDKSMADYFNKNGFTLVRGSAENDFESIKYVNFVELEKTIGIYNEFLEVLSIGIVDENGEAPEIEKFKPHSYFDKIRPRFVFYPSFENTLPKEIMYEEIVSKTNQAVVDFESIYGVDFKNLLESNDDVERAEEEERIKEKASDSLNRYWNQTISNEKVEYKFSILIRNNKTDISQGYVNFFISQGDRKQLSIPQKSQGFKWFSNFNLRLRAHEKELSEQGIILLIDEPGQGLHEKAQEDVRKVLEELALKPHIQIIYSTHQPILLGKEDIQFSRLLLAVRNDKDGSKLKTISQLTNSDGSHDTLSPIKSALGLVSIKNMPTDKKTLIVEGITEYFYLKALYGNDFAIIPANGVNKAPLIFSILYGWGVEPKLLVDDDQQGKDVYDTIRKDFFNDEDLEDFQKTVLKQNKVPGIESLLSKKTISDILSSKGIKYNNKKSEIKNILEIGKMIFAKLFYDHFSNDKNKLDPETKEKFQEIKNFMDK